MLLRSLVIWEVGLVLAIFMVAAGEYTGLVIARRQGLTRNVSRLVTHGLLMALSLIYAAGTFMWWRSLRRPETLTGVADGPTVNWTFLVLGAMIGVLASWELWQHAWAMWRGLSRSVARLVTHLAMLVLMIVLIGINVTRWQLYLDELKAIYLESLAPVSAPPPAP